MQSLALILKFVIMCMPAMGILFADNILWNIIFWIIYFTIGFYLRSFEVPLPSSVSSDILLMDGIMWTQVPIIIVIDLRITNIWIWILIIVWLSISYSTLFKSLAIVAHKGSAEPIDIIE